jgi:hypothetical protein
MDELELQMIPGFDANIHCACSRGQVPRLRAFLDAAEEDYYFRLLLSCYLPRPCHLMGLALVDWLKP